MISLSTRIAEIDGFRGTHGISVTRFFAGRIGSSVQFTIGNEYCSIDKYQAVELARKLLKAFE